MATLSTNFVQVHPIRLLRGGVQHLLLRRAPNEPLYPGIWQVITGRGETGESTTQTAARETAEEVNIRPIAWHFSTHVCSFYFQAEDAVVLTPVVACLLPPDAAVSLSEEHDAFDWQAAAEAITLLEFQTYREGVEIAERWGRSLLQSP